MSTPENTFIASVHRHLPPTLYRMKNHNQYIGGIADVWYSGQRDLWIEYKFIKVPTRDGTLIDLCGGSSPALSHLQQAWLRGRDQEGRHTGVIVGSKDGGVWYPKTTWGQRLTAEQYRQSLGKRTALASLILNFVNPA